MTTELLLDQPDDIAVGVLNGRDQPFKIVGERITEIEVIADPERLRRLDLAVLDD